jgi:hypothetical protein
MSQGKLPFLKLKRYPVSVAVWRTLNEPPRKGYWYSVSLSKSYKDENGKYQDTKSLNGDDLLKAAALLQEVDRRLMIQDLEVKAANAGDQPVDGQNTDDDTPF